MEFSHAIFKKWHKMMRMSSLNLLIEALSFSIGYNTTEVLVHTLLQKALYD